MATTVFKNIRVFDGEKIHQSATVVVKNGKIFSVSSSPPPNVEASATTIDGAGHTLLPGLIEAHMHAHLHTGEGTVRQLTSQNITSLRTR
jgi:imidazolonepropionase-like amidohydrolase